MKAKAFNNKGKLFTIVSKNAVFTMDGEKFVVMKTPYGFEVKVDGIDVDPHGLTEDEFTTCAKSVGYEVNNL